MRGGGGGAPHAKQSNKRKARSVKEAWPPSFIQLGLFSLVKLAASLKCFCRMQANVGKFISIDHDLKTFL